MSDTVKDLFLSQSNLKEAFNNVSNEVQKMTGHNISKYTKLKANFNKMAVMVYNKTNDNNRNLTSLNIVLTEKSTIYFKELVI